MKPTNKQASQPAGPGWDFLNKQQPEPQQRMMSGNRKVIAKQPVQQPKQGNLISKTCNLDGGRMSCLPNTKGRS